MMSMEEVIKLISTYGLAIVISGLVLYFAVKFVNILIDEQREKRGVATHDERTKQRNSVGAEIQSLLERLVLRCNADRAYVFEFHNGNLSLGGLPFLKMTNTYEALAPGIRSELHKRDSMPFQLFQTFVDAIYTREHLIMDTEQRTEEYSALVYEILEERNIKFTIRRRITDLNGKVIGYVGLDYCKGSEEERGRAEAYLPALRETATNLGALLSVNK